MSFLQIALKKTSATDFIKPLTSYIKNTFSGEVLNENKDALAELNQLRTNAVVRALDKHETSLDTIQRYYDQLCTMEAKLPITEDQIRISFTWYDAFDKGGLFGSTKTTLSNGSYEKFCVLFNIAALLSQIAHQQNHSTDDGLKTAAKYYNQAAGVFSFLKDTVYPVLQTLPTPDLSVSSLSTLSSIMLAQAQDCFYLKASADKMKDQILAKVAMQASDYYLEASRAAANYEVKSIWEKDWIPILQCKQAYYLALAEFHQGNVCLTKGGYGETVARYQKAEKYMNEAVKVGGNFAPSDTKTMLSTIKRAHETNEKDNRLIYLEKVPTPESLVAVGRAVLAKPQQIPTPMSANFQDLFNKLVPMAVHQALATYDSQKAALLNTEIGKLREATQFLNGVLASLNLPAAIEDLSGEKVPQSVLEKASSIRERGGTQMIDQMMQNLPDLLARNREIADETFRMMDDEEREDTQMREHFKERWNRTPSSKLTDQLRQEGQKYRSILDNAINADAIVKQKYNEHRRGFEILSKSEVELVAAIPKSAATESGAAGEAAMELRELMQEVETTKNERNSIEEEFKGATVDMQSKFLVALGAEGYVDAERITNENLDETFGSLKNQVETIVENQKDLIDRVQAANERFMAAKSSEGAMSERDQVLKDLAAAYDAYTELASNLAEGSKFYNDLTEILLKYQSKVNDLLFARKTEKDDLSKDLQQQAAKGTPAPVPAVPLHHQSSMEQTRAAPERPPPPRQPQQPAAPTPAPRPGQQPAVQAPPQAPPQNPYASAPYPQQNPYMPQPPGGYYAPPGGMPGYGAYQQQQPYPSYQQSQQYGYAPPYAQPRPPVGYGGYPYQQPPPQR